MAIEITGEYVVSNLKTKEVFGYLDEHNEVSVEKVKEVFKSKGLEIHYPYNKTTGKPSYRFIREIHYMDISPSEIRGVKKAKNRGYGFTKDASALIYYLENFPSITKIHITKKGNANFDKKKGVITLNVDQFDSLYVSISPENKRHTKNRNDLAQDFLHSILPKVFQGSEYQYIKGELHFLLEKIRLHDGVLSENDVDSIARIVKEGLASAGQGVLIDTKKGIDKVYIDSVIEEFEKLCGQDSDTETLEKKWQSFFKKHSWIFSFVFAYPAIFLEDEMYVGGTKYSGKGATFADFIYTNKLTKSIAVIEIKTDATTLMSANPYRKGADIYSIQSKLSGAIVQVSDQKDKLLKNWSSLQVSEPFNPKCVVIAGMTSEFKKNKRKSSSFELFRSSLSGVEIITFDEVKEKILILKNQLEKS